VLFYGLGLTGETYRVAAGGFGLLVWIVYFAALRWLIIQVSKNDLRTPPPLPGAS
jgi:type IV secretory pathway TrbD component